jgi:hypothetical protein
LWVSALVDLEPEVLDAACRKAMQTCKFFPTPAEIRGAIERAESEGFELKAEAEWQKLLAWVHANYFPDGLTVAGTYQTTNIRPHAPRLSQATEHAAKAAGGFSYLERCDADQLPFCRRAFLAAYRNVHETGQVEHLLGDGEAKRIFEQLCEKATQEPKQIGDSAPADDSKPEEKGDSAAAKSVPATVQTENGTGIPHEEVREVLTRISTPTPEQEGTAADDELRQRQKSMRDALDVQENYKPTDFDAWLAKHGLAKPSGMIVSVGRPCSSILDVAGNFSEGIERTSAPAHPQVLDAAGPESAENAVRETLVCRTGGADA